MAGRCLGPGFYRARQLYAGEKRIAGIISERGSVGSYRVRLHDRLSGEVVAEVWAGPDGSYAFERIEDRAYYVVAFDHGANPENAAVADLAIPEPTP